MKNRSAEIDMSNVRLVIKGSFSMDGRAFMVLELPQSLLSKLTQICFAPVHLVVEYAMQNLIDNHKECSEKRTQHQFRQGPCARLFLRVRPTLVQIASQKMKMLDDLMVEVALQQLVDQLESMRPGDLRILDAVSFRASDLDLHVVHQIQCGL